MQKLLVLAAAACAVAAGTASAQSTPIRLPATPTAAEFARTLAGSVNQMAGATRIVNTHCVQAAPGRYMCSYAVLERGTRECHLMQGKWTPGAASTITVTMAGRTSRCRSLRDAIRSLD